MPPLRADAARNRDKLLRSAAELFAAEGPDVALERIAADAGVGIGTLYRHFPDRRTLIDAAYRAEIDQLGELDELLAGGSGADALAGWLRAFSRYARTKGALSSVIHAPSAPAAPTARGTVVAALTRILAAGAADGSLRADADADVVLRALAGIWMDPDAPDWPERTERLARLIVDGLRP